MFPLHFLQSRYIFESPMHIPDLLHSVSLTQATRKGREGKEQLIEEIREAVEEFEYVYLFTVHNSKNQAFKNIRAEWKSKNSR